VKIISAGSPESKVKVRGKTGYMKNSDLGTKSLLELYFIDVGQGDGILIRMPDNRHLLIDGGGPRKSQPTNKNAADFVDWKFVKDYGKDVINLGDIIVSHNDQDHYGGLWDFFHAAKINDLDADKVSVENIWHSGVGWWVNSSDKRYLGKTATHPVAGKVIMQLMGNRDAIEDVLKSGNSKKLQGEWRKFVSTVVKARHRDGTKPPIERLIPSLNAPTRWSPSRPPIEMTRPG